MVALDTHFPVYGFAAHKGYGTAMHHRLIMQHGVCVEHRHSFAPIAQAAARVKPQMGEGESWPIHGVRWDKWGKRWRRDF